MPAFYKGSAITAPHLQAEMSFRLAEMFYAMSKGVPMRRCTVTDDIPPKIFGRAAQDLIREPVPVTAVYAYLVGLLKDC